MGEWVGGQCAMWIKKGFALCVHVDLHVISGRYTTIRTYIRQDFVLARQQLSIGEAPPPADVAGATGTS